MKPVKTMLTTKATASLEEEVREELKKPDPEPESAEAFFQKQEEEYNLYGGGEG